jgi:hypothetical protein
MIRIETTQGTLARRGFVDAEAAERVIDHWTTSTSPCWISWLNLLIPTMRS